MSKTNTEVLLPLPERLVTEAKAIPADAVNPPKRVREEDEEILGTVPENLRPYFTLLCSKADAAEEMSGQALKAFAEAKTQTAKGAVIDEWGPKIAALTKEVNLAKQNFWTSVELSLPAEHADKNLAVCAGWEVVEAFPSIGAIGAGIPLSILSTLMSVGLSGPEKCSDPDCPQCNPKQ